jgi:hypothetical protein
VYKNSIKTNPGGIETAKLYNWTNTANIIYQNIFTKGKYNASSRKKAKRR